MNGKYEMQMIDMMMTLTALVWTSERLCDWWNNHSKMGGNVTNFTRTYFMMSNFPFYNT